MEAFQRLLWDTELVLRRQLQAVDESSPVDPNMYTNNQQGGEESSQSRGRTVLTILYLCVLGLCFVVPVFYYFRLHCFEENVRRELELDFTTALEQSEQVREESRAARRKYIEERRARIVQLFSPVRMILKEENFPHLMDPNAPKRTGSFLNLDFESEKYSPGKSDNESATMASEDILSPYTSDDEETNDVTDNNNANNNNSNSNSTNHDKEPRTTSDLKPKKQQQGVIETKCECDPEEENPAEDPGAEKQTKKNLSSTPYLDEETVFVRIPVPGLPSGGSCLLDPTRLYTPEEMGSRDMRLAPGLCSICLCNYKVGSDIVWSSNESCDHVFHTSCIEKWLMKQREGPLCPCCRQDFIVDPLDLLEENNSPDDAILPGDNSYDGMNEALPGFLWNPPASDDDPEFGPIIVSAPGNVSSPGSEEDNIVYDPTQLEEGLRSPATEEPDEPTSNEELPPSTHTEPPDEQTADEELPAAIHIDNEVEEANEEPQSQENPNSVEKDDDAISSQV